MNSRFNTVLVGFLFVLLTSSLGVRSMHAQVPSPLQQRLDQVCALISGTAPDPASMFAPSFLAAVSPEQLHAGVKQITAITGSCSSIHVTQSTSPWTVKAEAITANNYSIDVSLSIDEQPPHHIIGLFFKPPVKRTESLEGVVNDLSKLPGQTSLCIVNNTTNTVVASKDTSLYLPTGSTFKLFILGELATSIQRGGHRWSEVLPLRKEWYSLPSGELHTWPVGAPLTLYSLAAMMISKSDNTATDHLLYFLGRERVEKIQQVMGHSNAALNVPFLSTMELFKLKFAYNTKLGHAYVGKNVSEKRKILSELSAVPVDSVIATDDPVLPDSVEWFSRTSDLCRAMHWLYSNTTVSAQPEVAQVLGINPGLTIDPVMWPHVGYKGGSESGVLNMTYHLQRKDGVVFTMSVSWLRTDAEVDLDAFSAIVGGAIRVLATVK